jgi:hypothetical protein
MAGQAHGQTPEDVLNHSSDAMGLRHRSGTIEVNYKGHWGPLVNGLQPALVDSSFRRASLERVDLTKPAISQSYRGPGGLKLVVRDGKTISVKFNGKETQDSEKRAAAAVVADAYRMFVTGPDYILKNGRDLKFAGEKSIGGQPCVAISAKLVPGLGFASSDDLVAYVDRNTGYIRRYQFSVNGLATTQGVVVDVTCSDFQPAGNPPLIVPRRFVEWIRRPFVLLAHPWRAVAVNG